MKQRFTSGSPSGRNARLCGEERDYRRRPFPQRASRALSPGIESQLLHYKRTIHGRTTRKARGP